VHTVLFLYPQIVELVGKVWSNFSFSTNALKLKLATGLAIDLQQNLQLHFQTMFIIIS
jgi:hypothetical protein